MKQPVRIRLSRKKGWRMPDNTVKVDRSTKWGNPFRPGQLLTVHETGDDLRLDVTLAVGLYEAALLPKDYAQIILELRGKNLACWCPLDAICHADVLIRLANL